MALNSYRPRVIHAIIVMIVVFIYSRMHFIQKIFKRNESLKLICF